MPLRRFMIRNYRCFRDRQELEIHPVTVVLGKNNSGKSALVRAPLVFASGFGGDSTGPIDLERIGPDPVYAFTDLIFERQPHGSIAVEFDVDGDRSFQLAAELQYVDEIRDAFVSEFALRGDGSHVWLGWRPALTASPPRGYTLHATGKQPRELTVEFHGLLPLIPELPERMRDELSLGPVRYLGPYRERLERVHRLPVGSPRGIGPEGQNVPAILADDRLRHGGELLATVNRFLNLLTPGWELDAVAVGPLWELVLRRNGGVTVDLVDAGAGLVQVLPILVQCAIDQRAGRTHQPTLQIIEEPEMHLHPAAHAELADLYLRTAQATGTRFMIETHSETLLLRLRRRIAEEVCQPDEVGVYVVEQREGVSTVRRVGVDSLGNLGEQWPEGYFSQDYHEVRALASEQLRRSHDAA